MDEFYKKLKNNLEQRPEPVFEERVWQRMENSLEQEGDKPFPLAWWAIAAATLLLLGTNFYWWKYSQAIYTNGETSTIMIDTIYQTKVVYQIDTIYKERVIREIIEVNTFTNEAYASTNRSLSNFNKEDWQGVFQQPIATSILKPSVIDNKDLSIGQQLANWKTLKTTRTIGEEWTNTVKEPLAELTKKDLLPLKSLITKDLVPVKIEAASHKNSRTIGTYLYAMRPKGLVIGINSGWAKLLDENINYQIGYNYGMAIDVLFSDHWGLWTGINFYRNNFETQVMDVSIGVPPIELPTDNLVFEKAKVPQAIWEYSAGLQYNWWRDRKWQPFLGAGYGVLNLRPYEIVYEFEDESTNSEVEVERSFDESDLLKDFLLFRAGMSYVLSEHWSVLLRGNYRTQINGEVVKYPNSWSVQGGINYKF